MLEHVTQAVAPPGSTFKLVVAAANQAHPVFAPQQVIPTGADFTYGGHTFGNWKPMGPMNLVQSIAISNDVYFYKLAVALGPEAMIDTARALGRGAADRDRPSRASPPATSAPRTRSGRKGGDVVRRVHRHPRHRPGLPAGHAAAERPVDRRGRHREPGHPATRPRDRDRRRHLHGPPAAGRRTPLPFADALGPVRDGMRAAVTGGTAVRLAGLPVPVGAKTGTAQDGGLPDGELRQLDHRRRARDDDPEIVMTALVQGPGTGGNSAKGVVADGLRYYLEHRAGRPRHRAGAGARDGQRRP